MTRSLSADMATTCSRASPSTSSLPLAIRAARLGERSHRSSEALSANWYTTTHSSGCRSLGGWTSAST